MSTSSQNGISPAIKESAMLSWQSDSILESHYHPDGGVHGESGESLSKNLLWSSQQKLPHPNHCLPFHSALCLWDTNSVITLSTIKFWVSCLPSYLQLKWDWISRIYEFLVNIHLQICESTSLILSVEHHFYVYLFYKQIDIFLTPRVNLEPIFKHPLNLQLLFRQFKFPFQWKSMIFP